jgi:hypothetical protein
VLRIDNTLRRTRRSITIWESEEALRASAAEADKLRQDAAAPSGSTIDSVEHYEIALTAGGKKATAR